MVDPKRLNPSKMTRRSFMNLASLAGAGFFAGSSRLTMAETLPFANGERPLVVFPQKRPLILLTSRPPQLETPFAVFNQGLLTPNDAFFVRYHLPQIPTSIEPATFRLEVKGKVSSPLSLTLDDLRSKFEPVEI